MTQLYYTAPPEEQFQEMKQAAIQVWRSLDAHPSYTKEKIDRIEHLTNVQDNFMFIVAMFDDRNQMKLSNILSEETCTAVRERMIDGGMPEFLIVF